MKNISRSSRSPALKGQPWADAASLPGTDALTSDCRLTPYGRGYGAVVNTVFQTTFGATVTPDGVRFRLWAPAVKRARLSVRDAGGERTVPMNGGEDGWFEVLDAKAAAGTRYAYLIDDEDFRYSDPGSRYQPDGVHGDSEVVDPERYAWPETVWKAGPWCEQVVYELHLGTFTPGGTLASAEEKLPYLAELGITAIELMPLSQAPGARGWGYDGVLPYAPNNVYGAPNDVKHFIDAAHACGLAVYLDVVYNHFGPEGNYLHRLAPQFFTERHHTPWGAAIDYSSPGSVPVRTYFIENALYWLGEYRFDGLRFDATQCIFDEKHPRMMEELEARARAEIDHPVHLIVENDLNEIVLQRAGYDGQWNDDVHHAAHVLVTGQRDGYYVDYADRPAWYLARALASGYGYQGESSTLRNGAHRGAPSADVELCHFINFIQNHDQIGNRPFGERVGHFSPMPALRSALACILLAPSPPMLFMGEEWNATAPFQFFCDFEPDLAALVKEGRKKEFASFDGFNVGHSDIPDATDPATFEACKLDWDEMRDGDHAEWLAFYKTLLAVRKKDVVPHLAGLRGMEATFEVYGGCAFTITWTTHENHVLRLDANLHEAPLGDFAPLAAGAHAIYERNPGLDARSLGAWGVRWSLT